jgi:hypothetical protein
VLGADSLAHAPPASPPSSGVNIPVWALAGCVTFFFGGLSAGLTVWKNDTLREVQVVQLQREDERKRDEIAQLKNDVSRITGEITRLKNITDDFQGTAMDKLDTILERDPHRRKR